MLIPSHTMPVVTKAMVMSVIVHVNAIVGLYISNVVVIFVVLAMGVILTWWWNGSSTKTKLCNLRLNCIQGVAGGKHMSIQLSLEVIHPSALVWSKGVFWLTCSIAPMIANMTPYHG